MHSNPHEDHSHDQSSEATLGSMLFIAFDRSLLQGERLGQAEATETFFAMTKLFQSKDVRRERKKETLVTAKICLVDVSASDVSRHQRNVHRDQRCDDRHFQFDQRHDRSFVRFIKSPTYVFAYLSS